MRILFALSQPTLLRHFEEVVLELARRGHDVVISASDRGRLFDSFAQNPRITRTTDPELRTDGWKGNIQIIRAARDYLRYLEPPLDRATKLRARALRMFVKALTQDTRTHATAACPSCRSKLRDGDLVGMLLESLGGDVGRATLKDTLALVEQAVPPDPATSAFLASEQPDLVLVTPLVNLGSRQPDLVKCARHMGIPVVLLVFSWDNLSTKGILHVEPDALIVWNEIQRTEAAELFGLAKERVFVTGAPRFDRFLELPTMETRDALCERHGLDPSQPIVTYLCSSEFVARGEQEFVTSWIIAVRAHPALAGCGIVIRTHPRSTEGWAGFDRQRWPNVGLCMPRAKVAEQALHDLLQHSAAAVGLNTSAELEAGLLGTPVFTVLAPSFAEGQQQTLHFEYLLKERGGFVEVGHTMDEHVRQIACAVNGDVDREAIRTFMERFVRPCGWRRPAAPLMADVIEQLARTSPATTATRA